MKTKEDIRDYIINTKLIPWAKFTFGRKGVEQAVEYGKKLCEMRRESLDREIEDLVAKHGDIAYLYALPEGKGGYNIPGRDYGYPVVGKPILEDIGELNNHFNIIFRG